ncbi:MAG: hypothetical protein AUJ33_02770 [Parcubacteria group bacterium CG1_02_40_25]|nr:MAG: hypothetical protein AUJ33_02770 [Parcubacteria group bacterium CG1_02_40_25]
MLSFASICPHPPIIIPEIGGTQIKKCQKTISAMKKLADYFNVAKPDTVIVITPHGQIHSDEITILFPSPPLALPLPTGKREGNLLYGNFYQFGHPEIKIQLNNNSKLTDKIKSSADQDGIPTVLVKASELDHGVLVPLYHLCQKITKLPKLIVITYSLLDIKTHFAFGQIIGKIIKTSPDKIAVIASGDLSHRLTPEAPAGYSPRGQEFDKKIISLLTNNNVSGILYLDANLIEVAGECGLRSIIILLGVLSSFKYSPQILSYEGPFGVGYGVVNFNLN